jgi:hypothetical protein
MKRIITFLLLISTTTLFSQTTNEIARLSQVYNYSTARGMSMGGAVGALQSEYASLGVNPAALGTFRMGQLIVTPALNMHKTNSEYVGVKTPDSHNSYLIQGAGIAYSFKSSGSFNRFNLSFGYNYNNNFNTYYDVQGSPEANQSLAQEIVNIANNGIIHFVNTDKLGPMVKNGAIYSLNSSYQNPSQVQQITTVGNTGEFSLSFGTSCKDKLYIGLSANLSNLNYEQRTKYEETATLTNTEVGVLWEGKSVTSGRGFNGRFGLIYSPNEDLSIGVAAQSPVYYSLSVENTATIGVREDPDSGKKEISPDTYDYTLQTPWRFTLSAAYNFQTVATISLDYEIVTNNMTALDGDFDNMLPSTAATFQNINDDISSDFNLAMNIRLGGEVCAKNFFIRGGVAYLGAPSKTVKSIISGSFGLGYRLGDARVDVAYRYVSGSEEYSTYNLSPVVTTALIAHQIGLTLSYRF